MAALSEYKATNLVKMLLIGNAGSGKTGALVSLVKAGYKLRILDYDNLLQSLVFQIKKHCPDKIGNVDAITLTDKWKANGTDLVVDGVPKAFVETQTILNNWPGLGKPETWGPDSIVVIDSLTKLSNVAMNWSEVFKAVRGKSGVDYRQVVGEAQKAIAHLLQLLNGKEFNTNVIITAHGKLQEQDGQLKMYPQAPGDKLSPTIPTYFATIAMMETRQEGGEAKRFLHTKATTLIDLRTPASLDKTYPIETGLADLFRDLRGDLT